MNPITATLRTNEVCQKLGVSERAFYRWMAQPYPIHHENGRMPRGRLFALPELVARLRCRRKRGLYGAELARVVDFDASERAPKGSDDLWLGDAPEERAAAFCEALTGEEMDRARMLQKTVTDAALSAAVPRIARLRECVLIHPAAVRFILTGCAAELPVGDGWASWVRALSVVNIPTIIEQEAA